MRACIIPTNGNAQTHRRVYYAHMDKLTAQQAIQELVQHGYSHRAIAEAANLNQSTVSRIASGEITNVLLSTSERILEAHRLTMGESTTDGE